MYQESKFAIGTNCSEYAIYLTGFWLYHNFKTCQGSEYTRVMNVPEFIKKTLHR